MILRASLVLTLLAASSSAAWASPETSAIACNDQLDNDGDGKWDCYDPDCKEYSFCHAAGPEAFHLDSVKPLPNNGLTETVVGAILLPVGVGAALGSIPYFMRSSEGANLAWASGLVAGGAVTAVVGAILIHKGIVKREAWNRRVNLTFNLPK